MNKSIIKKTVIVVIAISMILCLGACAEKEVSNIGEEIAREQNITDSNSEITDEASNEADAATNDANDGDEITTEVSDKEEIPEGDAMQSEGDAMQPDGETKDTESRDTKDVQNSQDDSAAFTGALSVKGSNLVNSAGEKVQLRGISTHGLSWFPQFVNSKLFKELKEDWGANVVRLAMYTAENGGYCTDGKKDSLKKLINDGVQYATEAGLYVIIDWHILSDADPTQHQEEAIGFFDEMSALHGDNVNVIYEICNEPNGGTSWKTIKEYALKVIPVIRANAPEAVIIVGTPNWSQYVDEAVQDPITEYDNIMYALHFYAATHKNNLRERMSAAAEQGLPIFVSEFGTCDASGNGKIDEESASLWIETMDKYGISYVCWNLANKDEASSLISSSCNKTSGFDMSDLSSQGQWLRSLLSSKAEAEGFTIQSADAQVIGTADANTEAPEDADNAVSEDKNTEAEEDGKNKDKEDKGNNKDKDKEKDNNGKGNDKDKDKDKENQDSNKDKDKEKDNNGKGSDKDKDKDKENQDSNKDKDKEKDNNGNNKDKDKETPGNNKDKDKEKDNNGKGNGKDKGKSGETALSGTSGNISWSLSLSDSWEDGGKKYDKYDMKLENKGGAMNSWTVKIDFGYKFTLCDSWNGKFNAKGNALEISNADWNGTLAAGDVLANIGFIICY